MQGWVDFGNLICRRAVIYAGWRMMASAKVGRRGFHQYVTASANLADLYVQKTSGLATSTKTRIVNFVCTRCNEGGLSPTQWVPTKSGWLPAKDDI